MPAQGKRPAAPAHAGDPLKRYRAKRDPSVSPEPEGGKARRSGSPRFVIHEHRARRLHWDLRLERDGVLASWAIPKGLPEAPGENRFAAATEDHPIEYLRFEGEIPKGHYGAGRIDVWDRGTFEVLKWERRKVEIALHGERVQGRYALFAIGEENPSPDWMIHRMDPPADPGREPMPERIVPMLARSGALPSDDGRWVYEIKWDGVRALAYSRPGELHLESRNLNDVSDRYPELAHIGRALGSHSAVLDGEIVVLSSDGTPSFAALQRRMHSSSRAQAARLAREEPVTYVVFDLLWLDGHPIMELPYSERRERLAGLDLAGASVQVPEHLLGNGAELLRASSERGLEGILAKRLDSPYEPGLRSRSWLKIKSVERQALDEGPLSIRQSTPTTAHASVEGREVRIANPEKVLYPQSAFTKRDLVEYYAAIAPALLAHLRGRPVTVTRWPDGVEGKSFFQKQTPAHHPDWVRTVPVASRGRTIDYTLAEDAATLVWLANAAAIELHVPLARAPALERPSAVVFDLDPGAPAGIIECCRVALMLQGMFENLGLQSFVKSSGSKGLQMLLPLNRDDTTYEQTKPFAKAVAELLEQAEPDLVVSRMTKARREGRVLIDWGQNDQKKTTICAYSLRAAPRPTVSTPLDWAEVREAAELGDPERLLFTADHVLARVAERGDLLAPVLSVVQELPRG